MCFWESAGRSVLSVHGGRCSPAGTRAMRFSWVFVATVLLVLVTGARCKRKFDGDFEFAEEVSTCTYVYTANCECISCSFWTLVDHPPAGRYVMSRFGASETAVKRIHLREHAPVHCDCFRVIEGKRTPPRICVESGLYVLFTRFTLCSKGRKSLTR